MGDVVNLNRFRKEKDREAAAKQAAENRVRHGMPKAARQKARREAEKARKLLDEKRLDE
jgi:hypothetical protein